MNEWNWKFLDDPTFTIRTLALKGWIFNIFPSHKEFSTGSVLSFVRLGEYKLHKLKLKTQPFRLNGFVKFPKVSRYYGHMQYVLRKGPVEIDRRKMANPLSNF